ncbi:hypothetical protein ACWKW6_29720 [Dyadobacter jiangsuensis]
MIVPAISISWISERLPGYGSVSVSAHQASEKPTVYRIVAGARVMVPSESPAYNHGIAGTKGGCDGAGQMH